MPHATIPQPPESVLGVGNTFEVAFSGDNFVNTTGRLADLYGQVYADAVCDDRYFSKSVGRALETLRPLTGDGLFTAFNKEPNWRAAHNVLAGIFSPMGVRGMFDDMVDIAQQLVLKFERFGPEYDIDISQDFTRLTLDTIALSAFSYRFNSFYSNEMHPFVNSMVNALVEAGRRARRLPFQNYFMFRTSQEFDADVAYIHDLCDKLVQIRRKNPVESRDLLNQMLNGKDKDTGLGLSDENIRYQLVSAHA
ncbi:hypothetical protein HK405_001133 [Cladochytrium tenue]|nr:hypothetical protein HK405_001133 [Cladochytrium tenue]